MHFCFIQHWQWSCENGWINSGLCRVAWEPFPRGVGVGQEHWCSVIMTPLCPNYVFLWNALWWQLGWRPPWGCLCGMPQRDQQRNIMKHELVTSTHLEGWLLFLQHLIWMDKQHLVGFRCDQRSVLWEMHISLHSSRSWSGYRLIKDHLISVTF